ncbi:MAG: RNA polymerase sigma factor [Planctomycetota bacterium]|jgi:RNA polymerase sigma-70 factor (ECF subfamily)
MTEATERLYEQVLVVRFQAGDETAFVEIVQRYHQRLRYYVSRLPVDAGRVDDVLQEVWLIAFRSLRRLRRPGALAAWLYRIARNAALAQQRRDRPRLGLDLALEQEAEAPAATEAEPDFGPEDAARMRACLDGLSAHHREVLMLRFLEGLSYEDIAGIVGSPLGTVRSRLHHAKRALRQAMRG